MGFSFGTIVLLMTLVGIPLMIAMVAIDDRIVRHICAKEGKTYSVLWLWNMSWHWRLFGFDGLEEAKAAGYLKTKLVLLAMWLCLIAVMFVTSWPPSSR
jgi:hypothetical protein